MTARYICLEGLEGTSKSTQTKQLAEYLRNKGYKVLETREPGVPLAPLTMTLRGIMLDKQYDDQLTVSAREMISQAIRSIHMEKVVGPALEQYDFIIQDRGLLSGFAYGLACGNEENLLWQLAGAATGRHYRQDILGVYDNIIMLRLDTQEGLNRASTKKEFAAGDAIEAKGVSFMDKVKDNFEYFLNTFPLSDNRVTEVDITGKTIPEVTQEIVMKLGV